MVMWLWREDAYMTYEQMAHTSHSLITNYGKCAVHYFLSSIWMETFESYAIAAKVPDLRSVAPMISVWKEWYLNLIPRKHIFYYSTFINLMNKFCVTVSISNIEIFSLRYRVVNPLNIFRYATKAIWIAASTGMCPWCDANEPTFMHQWAS